MAQAIVLGPGVLGKEAFEKQQQQIATEGGAIGIGPELQKPFVPRVAGAKPTTVIAGQAPLTPGLPADLGAAQRARQAVLDEQRRVADEQAAEARRRLEAAIATKAAKKAAKNAAKAAQPGKPSAPPKPDPAPVTPMSAPPVISFSETDVQQLLASNPQEWKVVLEAEAKRPEGPRPSVADMVLALPENVLADIPVDVIAQLRELVVPHNPSAE